MIAYSMLMIIKVSDLIDITFESKVSKVKVKYTQNISYGSLSDFLFFKMVHIVLYNDYLWCVDDNICFELPQYQWSVSNIH